MQFLCLILRSKTRKLFLHVLQKYTEMIFEGSRRYVFYFCFLSLLFLIDSSWQNFSLNQDKNYLNANTSEDTPGKNRLKKDDVTSGAGD